MDTHPANNSSVSQSDSDLSDQEQQCIKSSKLATAMKIDLKPVPFGTDLDMSSSPDMPQIYPEVLPAPFSTLNLTQILSSPQDSETLQSLEAVDPSLTPIMERLMELARLQAATMEKEHEKRKSLRPRPNTAITSNNKRRKTNILGAKSRISGSTAGNLVESSFAKLTLCPNASHTCEKQTTCTRPPLIQSQHRTAKSCKVKSANRSVKSNVSLKSSMPNRNQIIKSHRGGSAFKKNATGASNRKSY